jgi:aconitase B
MQRRKGSQYRNGAQYFRPDEDAVYAATHVIDLTQVESFLARYPNPDDVVPVRELEGTVLNGCFIGACTTAEEDLIIGAMVLEAGLKKGLIPVPHGKRKVVPGSLPILNRLTSLGLTAIYEEAGFEIGVPGCSYCVGMGADKAGAGEVWISSQNRNFENRMGTGAIGHLGSAATVAASSFGMKITDPIDLLDAISQPRLQDILNHKSPNIKTPLKRPFTHPVTYVEPGASTTATENPRTLPEAGLNDATQEEADLVSPLSPLAKTVLSGKIQRLPDFVDTDAVSR